MNGFQWRPKVEAIGYSYNWYVDNDMMCETQTRISSIVSAYFFGYFVGVFFFFMPNTYGRKPSMVLSLTCYTLGSGLIAYGNSIEKKTLGFFLLGVFHLKITLSYQYCAEFLENRHKQMALTFISLFDTASIGLSMFYMLQVDNNLVAYVRNWYVMGVVAYFLFLVIVPESPRYLFMKNPQSEAGIKVLNYISWFNGSRKRVPLGSVMDNIHQVIKDNNQLNLTSHAIAQQQLNNTI